MSDPEAAAARSDAPKARAPRPPISVPFLMTATMVSVFAATIYVPSLPHIAEALGTTATLAQVSLTAFVVTFGLMQVWHGPASDRVGRWRILAGSLVVFLAGTAACGLAPNIWVLIAGRILQGLGAAGVAVLPRAIARDVFDQKDSARVFTYLSMAAAIAATVAPLLGGGLQALTDSWRTSFLLLGVLTVYVLALAALRRRYLAAGRPDRPPGIAGVMADYGSLMRRTPFAFTVIGGGFMRAGYYGFIVSVPFVLTNAFGTAVEDIGLIMMSQTLSFVAANVLMVRIGERIRADSLIVLGAALALVSPVLMLAASLAGAGPVLGIALPVAVFGFGHGLAIPMVNARAVGEDPRMAGAGASLLGFWGYAIGAAGTLVAGFLVHETAAPMSIMMALTTGAALVCFVVARRGV